MEKDTLKTQEGIDYYEKWNHKTWIKDLLRDQEEDRVLFSILKDNLEGQDMETDDLLREIDRLELEIISELSKMVLNG